MDISIKTINRTKILYKHLDLESIIEHLYRVLSCQICEAWTLVSLFNSLFFSFFFLYYFLYVELELGLE